MLPVKAKKIFFFKDEGLKFKANLKPLPAIANIGNLLNTKESIELKEQEQARLDDDIFKAKL